MNTKDKATILKEVEKRAVENALNWLKSKGGVSKPLQNGKSNSL